MKSKLCQIKSYIVYQCIKTITCIGISKQNPINFQIWIFFSLISHKNKAELGYLTHLDYPKTWNNDSQQDTCLGYVSTIFLLDCVTYHLSFKLPLCHYPSENKKDPETRKIILSRRRGALILMNEDWCEHFSSIFINNLHS